MARTTFDGLAYAYSHQPAATQPAAIRDHAVRLAEKVSDRMAKLVSVLIVWRKRARQRHLLLTLDDGMLKDIAVSRATAEFEAKKGFWVP